MGFSKRRKKVLVECVEIVLRRCSEKHERVDFVGLVEAEGHKTLRAVSIQCYIFLHWEPKHTWQG